MAALTATPAAAQDLGARIASAPDGDITFQFAARPGVCGDGDVIVRQRPGNGTSVSYMGDPSRRNSTDFERLDTWCRPGPVQVRLSRTGDRIADLNLRVGATLAGATDLGTVDAAAAVAYLTSTVARTAPRRVATRALHAAGLADAESWPPLLDIARDSAVDARVRRSAVHWLATEASDRLLEGQPPLDPDTELRRLAVFALSRRADRRSRDALLDLARTGQPPIRAAAVYWLGIGNGKEGLALLEGVLTGR